MANKINKTVPVMQVEPNPIPKGEEVNYTELIGKQGKELERQGQIINWTFGFIVAILIVCFVAFVTFLLDAWRFHQESYTEFTKILEQVNGRLATPSSATILKLN